MICNRVDSNASDERFEKAFGLHGSGIIAWILAVGDAQSGKIVEDGLCGFDRDGFSRHEADDLAV